MGLYATAELVWGIPVVAWDESKWDDNIGHPPTPFWDEENEDWREFDGEIYVRGYGHFEDYDNKRGILTSTRVEAYTADCWDPTRLPNDLPNTLTNDKLYSKSEDQARYNNLPVSFYADAGWWLVASYG